MNLELKQKLLRLGKKRALKWTLLVTIIVFSIISILIAAATDDEYFNGNNKQDVMLNVRFLMGPFAVFDSGDEVYIAEEEEGYWYILATKPNTTLPIYGVTVEDEQIDSLPVVTVYGTGRYMEHEMGKYLVEFLNESSVSEITQYNFRNYFGINYFDTGSKPNLFTKAFVTWIITVVLAVILLGYMLLEYRRTRNIKNSIVRMEQDGTFTDLCNDYSLTEHQYDFSNMAVMITKKYVVSLTKNDLSVISLVNATNIFKSRMVNGEIASSWRVVIEKGDDVIDIPILSARSDLKQSRKQIDRIVSILRENVGLIERGAVLL